MIALGLRPQWSTLAGIASDVAQAPDRYTPAGRGGRRRSPIEVRSPIDVARPPRTETQVDDRARAALDERRLEEAALLVRIRDRDERALEALYGRYGSSLYSLAYQVTGGDRYAQDVVQEVFIAVWKDAARFDPAKGAVSSWLFALARHKAIDLVRKEANIRKRTADVDLEFEESPDDVDQEAWLRIRRDRVHEAIRQLPDAQRVALELAFFGGLTHVEVAEKLDIPLGTAKTRIRTALLKLRDIIGPSLSEMDGSDPRWITDPSTS
jgi:RNA polymerase sigma-70 factor (ECF subfamily)